VFEHLFLALFLFNKKEKELPLLAETAKYKTHPVSMAWAEASLSQAEPELSLTESTWRQPEPC